MWVIVCVGLCDGCVCFLLLLLLFWIGAWDLGETLKSSRQNQWIRPRLDRSVKKSWQWEFKSRWYYRIIDFYIEYITMLKMSIENTIPLDPLANFYLNINICSAWSYFLSRFYKIQTGIIPSFLFDTSKELHLISNMSVLDMKNIAKLSIFHQGSCLNVNVCSLFLSIWWAMNWLMIYEQLWLRVQCMRNRLQRRKQVKTHIGKWNFLIRSK